MAWKFYDPNPVNNGGTGDCVIRALAKALDKTWDDIYWDLSILGFYSGNWGNGNEVWRQYLRDNGFRQYVIPNTCPDCYSARDFLYDHPNGTYVLCFDGHVATAIDGTLYDSWNSLDMIPIFYFRRE